MMEPNGLVVYSKDGCPFCSLLKMELRKRGFQWTEFDLTDNATRQTFYDAAGVSSVPQVYVGAFNAGLTTPDGDRIGGWSDVSTKWEALEVAR